LLVNGLREPMIVRSSRMERGRVDRPRQIFRAHRIRGCFERAPFAPARHLRHISVIQL
jgi:hypothetical protein